jgi:tetratricopeptide (TPR) repeat protein
MIKSAAIVTPAVHPRTVLTAIRLCEAGRYEEALSIADELAGPEKSLIQGAAVLRESPERAKDLLSEASRLLIGDLADKARIWLAMCYWDTGERSEARTILESVKPKEATTTFILGLNKSIVESDSPDLAMFLLKEVGHLFDSVNELLRGKFLNQRGFLLRRLNESDRAIIAYEEARYWLEQVHDPTYLANVVNNLAGIYSDLAEFEKAHQAVDQSIEFYKQSGHRQFLGQAYDQKARIFLAQKKYEDAQAVAPKAVMVLEGREHKEMLARALITEALSLSGTGQYIEAFIRLDRADHLGRLLQNQELRFDVAQSRVNVTEQVSRLCEVGMIDRALEMSGGSYTRAAVKLNTTHQRLSRKIKKYGLKWQGKAPRRSIISC